MGSAGGTTKGLWLFVHVAPRFMFHHSYFRPKWLDAWVKLFHQFPAPLTLMRIRSCAGGADSTSACAVRVAPFGAFGLVRDSIANGTYSSLPIFQLEYTRRR
mmetsp:Transcript_549/g.1738  ORF Transcript_549/g.1738 Transcript_549/m.1738 type:complete len:102 (-) Transcript_549:1391-1696(-)